MERTGPSDRAVAAQEAVPTGLTRRKRLSYEQAAEPNILPTPSESLDFVWQQRFALLATFVVAWVWFAQVIAPVALQAPQSLEPPKRVLGDIGYVLATGNAGVLLDDEAPPSKVPLGKAAAASAPELGSLGLALATGMSSFLYDTPSPSPSPTVPTPVDKHAFVLTCAFVHTLLVFFGFAFGKDTLGQTRRSLELMTIAVVGAFTIICVALWLAWEWQFGPVPPLAAHLFSSEAEFVVVGAASATAWLSTSMLLLHTALGRIFVTSPALCGMTALAGVGLHVMNASAIVSVACFAAVFGGLAVALHAAHTFGQMDMRYMSARSL